MIKPVRACVCQILETTLSKTIGVEHYMSQLHKVLCDFNDNLVIEYLD